MECATIRYLFSEYIDGMLDEERKALLEEHLLACKECKEELAALQSVVTGIRSMESVAAPPNFLHTLHERMEAGFSFRKVLRTIFVPLRIKIPVELAAVAAMVILVFSLLHVQKPDRQMMGVPVAATQERAAPKTAAEAAPSDKIRDEYQQTAALKKPAGERAERKEKVIELALLVRPKARGQASALGSAGEAAPAPAARPDAIEQESALRAYRPQARPSQEPEQLAGARKEKRSAALPADKQPDVKKEAASPVSSYAGEAVSRVKSLIARAEGKVISIEYDPESGLPRSLSAEIPPQRYHSFYEALTQEGKVQAPPSGMTGDVPEILQIRIVFIVSDK